jgi:hypothetical protein
MDLVGGEITRAVQRHQVIAAQIDEGFQRLAALQATEYVEEHGAQTQGIDGIQDVAHLGVAGDVVNAVDGAEVFGGVAAAMIEGQQGAVFEREHRERRHQGIVQRDLDLARPMISEGAEIRADPTKERVSGEMLACFTESKSHGRPLHQPKW